MGKTADDFRADFGVEFTRRIERLRAPQLRREEAVKKVLELEEYLQELPESLRPSGVVAPLVAAAVCQPPPAV